MDLETAREHVAHLTASAECFGRPYGVSLAKWNKRDRARFEEIMNELTQLLREFPQLSNEE